MFSLDRLPTPFETKLWAAFPSSHSWLLDVRTVLERCVSAGAGMAAAGGIATGQNHVGKALMAVRQEFLDAAA